MNLNFMNIMNALEIIDLQKVYPTGVKALNGVSLQVKEGDFFGLLGPNGAGKTTIIGITTGLVTLSSGVVKVFGHDISNDFEAARRLIGVVPQEFNFSIFEKVFDIVVDQAGYYGIPRSVARVRAEKYLKELGLWEKRDVASRTLSGGMKRRLMIARALVHEPRLLILDEPTAGVDVELRRGMWEFISKLNKSGVTIILTTHYLEEAEQLCKNLAIINKGLVIEHGTKKELLSKLESQTYVLDLDKSFRGVLEGYTVRVLESGMLLEVSLNSEQQLTSLLVAIRKEGYEVKSIRPASNRLEELFMQFVEVKK